MCNILSCKKCISNEILRLVYRFDRQTQLKPSMSIYKCETNIEYGSRRHAHYTLYPRRRIKVNNNWGETRNDHLTEIHSGFIIFWYDSDGELQRHICSLSEVTHWTLLAIQFRKFQLYLTKHKYYVLTFIKTLAWLISIKIISFSTWHIV